MKPVPNASDERRVLLLAPIGRDATLLKETLAFFRIPAHICGSISEAAEEVSAGCAALIIAEEALNTQSVKHLSQVFDGQPSWSDLPLIILTSSGEQTPLTDHKLRMLSPLGNVSFVERPVRPSTLISLVKSALRARDRQYEFREQAKALQRSNEDLQRFANMASHDLQEPLRTITSFSQLLAKRNEQKLDDDSRTFLRYIVDGAARMKSLIRDLLEYSRHTGAEHPAPVPVDCNIAVSLVLQHLHLTIEESHAAIAVDRLPLVLGQETRIVQVFQNLIGNALKYCTSRPEVRISSFREGNFWVFAIQDNGIGIAPEYQNRIFVLFQRLHRSDEYPGSGIGLATCKRIIEQYGGRIWVHSTPGVGSTFYFSLLACESDGADRPEREAPADLEPSEAVEGSRRV